VGEGRRAGARLAAGFAARAMIVARVEAAALAARAAITGATEAEATEHDIIMGSAFSTQLFSPRDFDESLGGVRCGSGRACVGDVRVRRRVSVGVRANAGLGSAPGGWRVCAGARFVWRR
jgi:hypothetical protein